MKIIHVYDGHERVFPGEGSVPTVVYYIAKYTAKKGHDVTVLERRWTGTDYQDEADGIKFVRFNLNICSNISNREIVYDQIRKPVGALRFISDRLMFAVKTNEYLKKDEFDVLHVHLPFAANILININRKLSSRMVYTAHIGQEEVRLPALFKNENVDSPIFLKLFSPDLYLMKRVSMITVMHEGLANRLIQYGFKKDSVYVIPHGIDIATFDNIDELKVKKIREKFVSEEKITVLFAATLTPHKGVEYLVKSADILINEERLNVKFILAGNISLDKAFVEKIKRYIEEKGLSKNVVITGFLPYDDLKALYRVSDIFVYPLLGYGGVAISLLEAMAAGLPLIATNIGGLPTQVRDGWNGFLVEPANEKQLAEKIKYLIDHPEERIKMGINSRKLAEGEFNWDKIAEKYIEVYKKVLSQ